MDENAPLIDYTGVGVWISQARAIVQDMSESWGIINWTRSRLRLKEDSSSRYQSTLHWLAVF